MEQFGEAERRVAEEDLGVLRGACRCSQGKVDLVDQFLGSLEQACGLVGFSGGILAHAYSIISWTSSA